MAESSTAAEHNRAVHDALKPGIHDYWKKMAAPRFRVRVLVQELSRLRPTSIVDLGCGNGALMEDLHAALPQTRLTGVDIAAAQLAQNRKAFPWAQFHEANLSSDLPPELGTFAAAVSSELIEHLDDPDTFLTNARRVVEPGGHILLTTQSGTVQQTERRVGHVRHFTPEDLKRRLERAGLIPVRVWNAGWPFHDLSKWYANLNPDASMEQFGDRPYGLKEDAICATLRLAFRFNSQRRGAQLFAVARRPM